MRVKAPGVSVVVVNSVLAVLMLWCQSGRKKAALVRLCVRAHDMHTSNSH